MATNASPRELATEAKAAHEAGRTRFTISIEMTGMRSRQRTGISRECSAAIEAVEAVGWEVDHFSATVPSGDQAQAFVLFKRR